MFRPVVRLFAFALTAPNYVGAPPGQNNAAAVARVAAAVALGTAGALVGAATAAARWLAGALGIWP